MRRAASGMRRFGRGMGWATSSAGRRSRGVVLFALSLFAADLVTQEGVHAQQRGRRAPPLVARDGTIDWNRYYNATETNAILRELARRHPNLTELYSIGKSFKGQDLMVIEITNEETGKAADKPALYLDGGVHAGELTASAVALYTAAHLIQNYGKDERITKLLDTRAFYIRPKFNPDGSDLVLERDEKLRSTVRPWDDDGDGAFDEDPPDDLDGNGRITQMRVPDPGGDWKAHPADSRLLVRRSPDDTVGTFYFLTQEGIDNDGDGEFNEDGVGGIDMNRNFPRNWVRAHAQPGAGPFPLSEPETFATVRFVVDRPNIAGLVHGHTSGGFVYRLPSSMDPALFDTTDLALIEHMGRVYTETTKRPVQPSATHATDHRYGTLIGWAYNDRGIVGWVPEYVPRNSWVTDYDEDGYITELEALRHNDEKLDSAYFSPWRKFPHPQLGEVEIGGWYSTFWGQNPPAQHLEDECKVQLPWILSLLEASPLLTVQPRVSGSPDGYVRVNVTVRNEGWLATHMTERGAIGRLEGDRLIDPVVAPPVAELEVTGGEIVGPKRVVVGHLAGSNPYTKAATERSRTVTFLVRKRAAELKLTVRVEGGPGGNVTTNPIVYR